jgi:DNA-binding MarR family transcriptional regulator
MGTVLSEISDSGGLQGRLTFEERTAFESLIRKVVKVQRQVDHDLIHEQSMTLREVTTLQCLSEANEGQLRMKELATATNVSLGRVTRVIQKLESQGLVARKKAADDGRGWNAIITDAGRTRIRQSSHSYAISVRRNFLHHLDPRQLQALLALLECIPPSTKACSVLAPERRA